MVVTIRFNILYLYLEEKEVGIKEYKSVAVKSTIIKQLQLQHSKQEDQHIELPQIFWPMKHKVCTLNYSHEKGN